MFNEHLNIKFFLLFEMMNIAEFIVLSEEKKQLTFYISKNLIKSQNIIENKISYVLFFNNLVNLLAFWYGLSLSTSVKMIINHLTSYIQRKKVILCKKIKLFLNLFKKPTWLTWSRNYRIHSLNSLE